MISFGGDLLNEQSLDYPLDPASMPLIKYYLGLFVQWTRVSMTLVIGLKARLGSQVYSPKTLG